MTYAEMLTKLTHLNYARRECWPYAVICRDDKGLVAYQPRLGLDTTNRKRVAYVPDPAYHTWPSDLDATDWEIVEKL